MAISAKTKEWGHLYTLHMSSYAFVSQTSYWLGKQCRPLSDGSYSCFKLGLIETALWLQMRHFSLLKSIDIFSYFSMKIYCKVLKCPVVEWLALVSSDHAVLGLNPAGGRIPLMTI